MIMKLLNRCYVVDCDESWYDIPDKELEKVSLTEITKILDERWLTEQLEEDMALVEEI